MSAQRQLAERLSQGEEGEGGDAGESGGVKWVRRKIEIFTLDHKPY